MSWFEKILPSIRTIKSTTTSRVPEGVWAKCDECNAALYKMELERNLYVCPKCNHYHRLGGRARLLSFLDKGGYKEIGGDLEPGDPLKFKDSKRYKERLHAAQKKTGEKDALIALQGSLHGLAIVAAAFDFDFMGGSMGSVVGERFALAATVALAEKIPFVCFSASGGARMQEGILSLMQMAKTSAALAKLSDAGIPFISVLTDPTMGGVSASLAMLGDIIIAEPKSLIGFAGPRVIEQTVRQVLPKGFQRSEFLLEHGAIDMIVERSDLRGRIASLLAKLTHQTLDEALIADIYPDAVT